MPTPEDRRYTEQHEWVQVQQSPAVVRIGITDHAQDALGDIVFVQLPEVGEQVSAGGAIGEVESTKSVSDVYSPVTGVVAARNEALTDAPETLNADPYGAGWLVEITLADAAGDPLADLMDAAAYQGLVENG